MELKAKFAKHAACKKRTISWLFKWFCQKKLYKLARNCTVFAEAKAGRQPRSSASTSKQYRFHFKLWVYECNIIDSVLIELQYLQLEKAESLPPTKLSKLKNAPSNRSLTSFTTEFFSLTFFFHFALSSSCLFSFPPTEMYRIKLLAYFQNGNKVSFLMSLF